ncbi:LysR family transcriptional regulator [Cognatishimia maritima]|uniref:Transcriptional regulator, LysR family n=1 Tax=Cognatishimia maritima TaxID=870908 RepID=A0A1M5VVS9_9RHOB|nr:LysR family transcriptional regulator [Cognatishimia maritima]SHH79307.1 transcriptional regulator, LysR family [Cognatishimia maritima]
MVKRAVLSSLSDIDIRLLRIFLTVTECGGFAASELELNIGRSTISKHIADLETRIGLILCNRGPAGFSLTEEGEQVIAATRRLLSRIDEFQNEIDNVHATLTGTLRIGIFDQSSTNPAAKIHHAIQLFDNRAPEVDLEIVLERPSALESRIVLGSLETAIVPMYKLAPSFNYLPLYSEQMTLYCGETHPLYGSDPSTCAKSLNLGQYKYAGYGFNSPNMIAGRGLGLTRAARVKEEEALSLLIQSGRYIGYLADHVAETFLKTGKVWAISPKDTRYSTDYGAITRKQLRPDRKTEVFLKCLQEAHGTDSAKGSLLA